MSMAVVTQTLSVSIGCHCVFLWEDVYVALPVVFCVIGLGRILSLNCLLCKIQFKKRYYVSAVYFYIIIILNF